MVDSADEVDTDFDDSESDDEGDGEDAEAVRRRPPKAKVCLAGWRYLSGEGASHEQGLRTYRLPPSTRSPSPSRVLARHGPWRPRKNGNRGES
jgi:hypothetical protein